MNLGIKHLVRNILKPEKLSTIFILISEVINNETLRTEINENFDQVAPIAFCYERNTEFSKNVSSGLRQFYLNDQDIDHSKLDGLSEV